jgi:putative transposase
VVRKKPLMIVSDDCTELTSHAILHWQEERGVGWYYIAAAKPVQNAFVERRTRLYNEAWKLD